MKKTRSIKSCDIFGDRVHLNVKGRETHGTFFGASLTLIIILYCFAFGVHKFTEMITYENNTLLTFNKPFDGLVELDWIFFEIKSEN